MDRWTDPSGENAANESMGAHDRITPGSRQAPTPNITELQTQLTELTALVKEIHAQTCGGGQPPQELIERQPSPALPEPKVTGSAKVEKSAKFGKHSVEPQKRSKTGSIISNILFYCCLLLMVLMVFIYSSSGSGGNIFGYSYYNILTTSMQSTIPRGSFILVRQTAGADLEVGDDITFLKNANTIVTHRIIEILPNYEDSGQYGFRTQGTDNPAPDANITYEGNVIGKVVFHMPVVGFVLDYIANHVWFVLIGFALILALSFFLKVIFSSEKPKEDEEEEELPEIERGIKPDNRE